LLKKGRKMASERVIMILKSKGAPFSEKELTEMSDKEGWKWIYTNFPPKPKDHRFQICFTGQSDDGKEHLKELAKRAGYKAVSGVTKELQYLCIGDNPGPSKLEKAKAQSVKIISTEEFMEMIGTED
jgi:NAD-dependent DNA ligase